MFVAFARWRCCSRPLAVSIVIGTTCAATIAGVRLAFLARKVADVIRLGRGEGSGRLAVAAGIAAAILPVRGRWLAPAAVQVEATDPGGFALVVGAGCSWARPWRA